MFGIVISPLGKEKTSRLKTPPFSQMDIVVDKHVSGIFEGISMIRDTIARQPFIRLPSGYDYD